MPDNIKKVGSFFILSTYVTSLAIAVTIFAGTVLKGAYDSSNEVNAIHKTTKNIQVQMGELFQYHHDTLSIIKQHKLLINRCKQDITQCQDFRLRHIKLGGH